MFVGGLLRGLEAGSPDDDLTQERFRAWVHPDDRGIVEGAIERSAAAGEPVDVEYRIVAADGSLGGFSAPGGARTKRRMLQIEGAIAQGDLGFE